MPALSEQESPGAVPDINPELSPEQSKNINHLLQRHRAAFTTKPGRTDRMTMKVETGEARPVDTHPTACQKSGGAGRSPSDAQGWHH